MAKYKLTMVHELEDNEQAMNDSELQKYVEDAVFASLGGWDRVRASLKVNDKRPAFKAERTDIEGSTKKAMQWPWHCSMDRLPTPEDIHVIACKWDEDFQMWIDYDIYEFRSDEQVFIDDQEIPTQLYPSPNVWWRTVAEPEPLNKLRP